MISSKKPRMTDDPKTLDDANTLDDPKTLPALVALAGSGDGPAWRCLVERFTPLVTGVMRRYRLNDSDADDVAQTVWLRLVEHIRNLREPRALPGWIVTTTKNEALRVLVAGRRLELVDPEIDGRFERTDAAQPDDDLLRNELCRTVRTALGGLRPEHREFLLLLFGDPTITYNEIGLRLGMPVGSIGPTRARFIKKLRAIDAIRQMAS